jgi:hypothetical protein
MVVIIFAITLEVNTACKAPQLGDYLLEFPLLNKISHNEIPLSGKHPMDF